MFMFKQQTLAHHEQKKSEFTQNCIFKLEERSKKID